METIGALVVVVVAVSIFILMIKHQRVVGWWIQTPHYNKGYQRKMLKRLIEDAQDELDRLEDKNEQ